VSFDLRFGGTIDIGDVFGGDGFEFASDGVGREAGAEKAAVERSDFVVGDLTTGQFQFALDAKPDGGTLGGVVTGFGQYGFDVAIGYAAGAEVASDAVFALAANLGALTNELLGVAVVVNHAVFFEAGHDQLGEELVVRAAREELFHFRDGVGPAHQGALSSFIKLGFGFELAGFAEHERRIEEIEGISHSRTKAGSSEWGRNATGRF